MQVRNLDFNVRGDDLRDEAERIGPVRDVYIPLDYHTSTLLTVRNYTVMQTRN